MEGLGGGRPEWPTAAGFSPSFLDVLRASAPEMLPKLIGGSTGNAGGLAGVAEGTTIAALKYAAGVVVAGDRRATEGFQIAHRDIEKVFPADEFSAVAIAGAAGPALEMVRLFQTELEHYEKVECAVLSLEGKANRLAQMIRANLPMAMQGLVVVPLFAGYDPETRTGRIFRYDVTGGRFEEADFHSGGSGGRDARATLKKRYRAGLPREEAVQYAVEALFDAAEEDTATGGPDPLRGIYPLLVTVSDAGYERVADSEVSAAVDRVVAERHPHGGELGPPGVRRTPGE
ncbi:MAG: proteasome subunit beta [Actinomycetota bacterium]